METGYAVEAESPVMAKQIKKKKPGFIKRWFAKMSREAWEEARQSNTIGQADIINSKQLRGLQISTSSNIDQPERALHFTVYVANGGRIVETRRQDRKTERSTTGLYIITNDQDFGKEIDKIITMESLKG